MAIIGLCGYPGSGKSEVRKILVRDFGFEDINSKSVINHLAQEATGVPQHKFSDPLYKDGEFEGVPLRKIAAHMGYAVEDLFGEDYLIRKALVNHRVSERPDKNFVVDSLRMRQPVLLKNDMLIWEIIHPTMSSRGHEPYDQYELAESAHIIENWGDLKQLHNDIEKQLYKMSLFNGS